MNIELQVGRRYETRGGMWVGVVTDRDESAAGTHHEFVGYTEFPDGYRANGRSWRSDGRFSDSEECCGDLIRELPDASSTPESAAEPVSDTQAPLRLEVGKWYRRRDGEVVKVERIDTVDDLLPFLAGGVWYSSSGKSCVADEHPGGNLIEEIPAPVAEAVAEMGIKPGPVTATDGPATEKVVAHWDRERFIGIEASASTAAGADDAWLRANLADTRAGIARKYAQAAMFVMLGVAAIVFAIGTSVQA